MANSTEMPDFTDEDRYRVEEVLERISEEMRDNYNIAYMFKPYAEIVKIALTDDRITTELRETSVDLSTGKKPTN